MILFLNNGKQIRGDLIRSAVLRSDMAPVPVTLEAEIRIDDDMGKRLAEGQALTMANGDALQIVKAEPVLPPAAQGPRQMAAVRIFAVLQACHSVASQTPTAPPPLSLPPPLVSPSRLILIEPKPPADQG